MWPLSIVFLFALNAPQQKAPVPGQDFRASKLPEFRFSQSAPQQNNPALSQELRARKLLGMADRMKSASGTPDVNLCFTMRSYVFHREDGQAPKLVSTTTCTPASTLRTLQTSPAPPARLVPAK